MEIREMLYDDVFQICSLQKDYIELNWSQDSFYKEVNNKKSISLIAKSQDKLIGYIVAKIIIDEAQILNFFVQREQRNQGVGTLLLHNLINRLGHYKVRTVFLETRRNNENAIRLYEQFGFTQVGVRRNYYVNPTDDGIMMIRVL